MAHYKWEYIWKWTAFMSNKSFFQLNQPNLLGKAMQSLIVHGFIPKSYKSYSSMKNTDHNVAHAMTNEPSWYMYNYKIRHVAEYTIPNKFWKENRRILIQNLRNSVFWGFVDTKPILLRVMGWRWGRDMSQQEPIVTHFTDVYICNRASMR